MQCRIDMRRRPFLVAAGALTGLGVLPAQTTRADPSEPLRIGEGEAPDYTHFYVADKLDLWAHNGISATSAMFAAGALALDALVAGKVDIATCAETPLMFAAVNGLPVRVIATIMTDQPFDLIAGPNIPSLNALKGKKIGYGQGTNTQFYLYLLLKSRKLTWQDITAINLQAGTMVPSLVSGAIDGFVWNEPLISEALSKGPQFHRLHSDGLYYGYDCVVAMETMIDKNPNLLARALESLMAADRFIKSHPSSAQKILADTLKLDPSVTGALWKGLGFGVALDRGRLIPVLAREARWAADSGLIRPGSRLPNFETVVVDKIYKRARTV